MAEELLRKGVEADGADGMRWLAACEPIFIPAGGAGVPRVGNVPNANLPPFTRWQRVGVEAEVRVLLEDSDARVAMYRIAAWRRLSFDVPVFVAMSGGTADGLLRRPIAEEYWWHARNFLFLAIATGREDLLDDAEPDKLAAPFEKWLDWIARNHFRLRASSAGCLWTIDVDVEAPGDVPEFEIEDMPDAVVFPELPFAHWRGPLPLAPRRHPRPD